MATVRASCERHAGMHALHCYSETGRCHQTQEIQCRYQRSGMAYAWHGADSLAYCIIGRSMMQWRHRHTQQCCCVCITYSTAVITQQTIWHHRRRFNCSVIICIPWPASRHACGGNNIESCPALYRSRPYCMHLQFGSHRQHGHFNHAKGNISL